MFARTDRLLLRPGWLEDAPALAAAIGEQAIVRNLATAPWPYHVADARTFLARDPGALPSLLILARTAGKPRLVGGIGLATTPQGEVELGYWIAQAYWNQGYATEAGHALLALARDSLGLCRVVAGHFTDNPASGRVLGKLGFTATGDRTPRHSAARGEEAPFQGYALNLCSTRFANPLTAFAGEDRPHQPNRLPLRRYRPSRSKGRAPVPSAPVCQKAPPASPGAARSS